MTRRATVRAYNSPAGGWGASAAFSKALVQQGIPVAGAAMLLGMNKHDGFDCPGCAWPDPKTPSLFEFCENGAKALAWEATAKRCTPEFFSRHTVSELRGWSDYDLEMVGRLTHPMSYDPASDKYVPVSWDDAFSLVARVLNALPGPDAAEFYTSGRASNEAAFLFQAFARQYGTNNFPDCSNMCHEATSVGLPPQLGVGKGTVLLEDFDGADAIFIFGQNPGTNSPRAMTALRDASRRGAKIVSFNPFRERALERFTAPQSPVEMATLTSTPISSCLFQVKVGGDVAALKGIAKALVEADDQALRDDEPRVIDIGFVRGHTAGYDAYAEDLRQTAWPEIEAQSGLARDDLTAVARIYAGAQNVICVWGMGITQHAHGTQNVQQIVNLLLLRGNIGRPGAGACPVRGHSNVQGNRTVGITEKPTAEFLDRMAEVFAFDPPRKEGHNVVHAIEAMIRGEARAFIALGGNFAAAIPDTGVTQDAMRTLDLTVQVSTKLNRGHVVHGRQALILPCLARSEIDEQASGPQAITVEDSMSMVHASRGRNPPASPHLRSETAIVAGMAAAVLGRRSSVRWAWLAEDYARIRTLIEQVFPMFQGYEARIAQPGGFHLASTARERVWATQSGRANFMVFKGLAEDRQAAEADALVLTTMRSHDQYNTTLYSVSDRYRGVFGGRWVVFVNPREMERRQLAPGGLADMETICGDGVERVLRGLQVVPYALPDGCCGAYYPEANPLIPLAHRDPDSGTPSAKSIPVRLRPHAGGRP